MKALWNAILYKPLYNGLVFLVGLVGGDVGLAVVILTVIVKMALYPLTKRQFLSQLQMKSIEPDMARIRETYKDDKTLQSQKTMELYKEKKINPFSGCLVLLIQFPIIIALYIVFLKGFPNGVFDANLLYHGINIPNNLSMKFLGLFDVRSHNIVLALLAGASQFLLAKMTVKKQAPGVSTDTSFSSQLSRSMNMQVLYIFPILIMVVAYKVAAAVALYWVTSNIVTLLQQIYIERKLRTHLLSPSATYGQK